MLESWSSGSSKSSDCSQEVVCNFMFELQGVVSTVGSFLLNPECELKMSVVDIFYSKMIGECVYEGARERTTCCLVFILPS